MCCRGKYRLFGMGDSHSESPRSHQTEVLQSCNEAIIVLVGNENSSERKGGGRRPALWPTAGLKVMSLAESGGMGTFLHSSFTDGTHHCRLVTGAGVAKSPNIRQGIHGAEKSVTFVVVFVDRVFIGS